MDSSSLTVSPGPVLSSPSPDVNSLLGENRVLKSRVRQLQNELQTEQGN